MLFWKKERGRLSFLSAFAGPYAEAAAALAEQAAQSAQQSPGQSLETGNVQGSLEQERVKLEAQTDEILKQLKRFQTDVSFGVGRIWRDPPKKWIPGFLFEFFGSLLTGILVSIGAPCWHDLMRALSGLRRPKKTPEAEQVK